MSQTDFVARGQALVAAGQYQEAVKVCRLGLLGRPTTVEGRVVLGAALLALKRFDEVLAEMRVALELDHGSVGAQTLKAEALFKKGDPEAALEVLKKLKQQAPTDAKVAALLAEAEGQRKKPRTGVNPAVGFVSEPPTRHYPHAQAFPSDENSEGNFTRPTSLSSPGGKGTGARPALAANLAVGDKSGTMEVDELDALLDNDDDDDLAPPPPGKPASIIEPRGSIVRGGSKKASPVISTVELDDDELVEVETGESQKLARRGPRGPKSSVRQAVARPSGPLGEPRQKQPTEPPLAQQLYQQLPTAAAPSIPLNAAPPAMPLGPPPMVGAPGQMNNASARTVAIQPAPSWAQSTVVAGSASHLSQQQSPVAAPHEPTGQAAPYPPLEPAPQLDAAIALLQHPSEPVMQAPPMGDARPHKTGIRKSRSRLQIVLWVTIGVLVIGGGVFAGFQIRAMRLHKEIDAERSKSVDAAKTDTFAGWLQARNSLAGIVHASATIDNRAALARTRALIAFEFLDGIPEAKAAVDATKEAGGIDTAIGQSFVALQAGDAKAARAAADAATKLAPADPAAMYATGEAQLLANDLKGAATSFKAAADADARPLYQLALARVQGEQAQWDDAFATVDKVLAATPDHPGALLAKAFLLADAGRLTANANLAGETKQKLDKLVAESAKPSADQPRGVSAGQAAYASIALALCDFALARDFRGDVQEASSLQVEDQRFAETTVEAMFAIGHERTLEALTYILKTWPASTRGRLVLAQLQLSEGHPTDALDTLGKNADVMSLPRGLAVRGAARLANAELDLAMADFDAALKKWPGLEAAVLGKAQVLLARGDVDGARRLVEPKYNVNTASIPLATTYAQVLRLAGDRDKARALLERIPDKLGSAEVARAQLELARIYRDSGDNAKERAMYAEAEKHGNREAPIEAGVSLIDDASDPSGGRDSLNKLLAADKAPSPRLVLETARARMLMGDHAGATQLLDSADKLPNVTRWLLDREKARLAYRRGDVAGAADAITRALEDCGGDGETFLLAADIASDDAAGAKKQPLQTKLLALVDARIKTQPEAQLVAGKLALAAHDLVTANAAFAKALADLDAQKASPHRRAQANFGLAAVYYYNQDDPNARDKLDLVLLLDPSIYAAYAFYADILKEKDGKAALAKARKAIDYNPEFVEGWGEVGAIAKKLGDKRALDEATRKLTEIAPTSEALKELR